jgi:hypothetical protein
MQGKQVYRRSWVYYRKRKRRFFHSVYTGTVNLQIAPLQIIMQEVAPTPLGGVSFAANLTQIIIQVGNPQPTYGTVLEMASLEMELALGGVVATGGATLPLAPMQQIANMEPLAPIQDVNLQIGGLQIIVNPIKQTYTADATLTLVPQQIVLRPGVLVLVLIEADTNDVPLEEFPVEIDLAVEINLELEEIHFDDYQPATTKSPTVPAGKFAEANRSSSSIVIFGSDPGPFKFNPSAAIYRRGGPSHILQLGTVKPNFTTVVALFELLTHFAELQPNEFTYQAPGGFLKIWNQDIVQASLIPDGDTPAIPITVSTVAQAFSLPVSTSLFAKRQLS